MDVRNCKECGRIFNYVSGSSLCPSCVKDLDKKFEQVKEYIYDHPGAGIQEVSEANEVSTMQIKQWIRQERLSFTEESAIGLDCEKCGTLIKTGRYCNSCKNQMANSLENVYKKPAIEIKKREKETAKMRFLDDYKK